MELSVAIALIERGVPQGDSAQVWMDFGAGKGLFSKALASRLPAGSTIYAIDKDGVAMRNITLPTADVALKIVQGDFLTYKIEAPTVTGILMANSIHFVANKLQFLRTLRKRISPDCSLIFVEYDTDVPNAWVPYPLSFHSMQQLMADTGFSSVEKIGDAPSAYRNARLYAAVVRC